MAPQHLQRSPLVALPGQGVAARPGGHHQAVVEQHHDEKGICWPVCIAPYEVEVIPLDVADGNPVWETGTKVADELIERGVEVVVDDRKERPGVKFKDADLIGYPLRVVVGPKTLQTGELEVKVRKTGEVSMLPLDSDYIAAIKEMLQKL